MENKVKMIRLWKFLIYYSFILVLIGCENVRSDQLGMQPQSKKEEATPTFLPGNTKKVESQKNINIITLLMLLGLLSAQLTPVNSLAIDQCAETWDKQKTQIEEIRTLLHKSFSTFLFATKDVDTTTLCSLEASDTTLQTCQNDCTDRLNKLATNEKIRTLMHRYNSTSNNNETTLYGRRNKIRIRKENGDNYPTVAFTYKKNGTVMFYGWKNLGPQHPYTYKSIPDEINKIWKKTSNNQTERIKQLEKLVALLMNLAYTNDSSNSISLIKPTLAKWCNERNQDAAMGLIEAIEQIVDLIEIEEKLQNLEPLPLPYATKDIINKSKYLIQENNLLLRIISDPYKRGCFPPEILNNANLQEMEQHYGKVTSNNCTTSQEFQDRSKIDEYVSKLLDIFVPQYQKDSLFKAENWTRWFPNRKKRHTGKQQKNSWMQHTGKQQKNSWMRR
ncbi:hypothetical protein [Candidatus Cardinium hertigii]|uniref:Lipoprotein n=1 Tax=Candidatus Cardinium hertigii TaxID=247481 RepID=A0A2Z3LHM5_9BACT|nr:hypothetical protein [Candidatus Cardinium hertigii]AWN82005.1 hypothetical protein DK880_00694 [Candidatus Cardinium hertigii]